METTIAGSAPESEPPLLPPVLLRPSVFLWLWTLPVGVLLLLNLQAYWLIEGNLSASQHSDAWLLGGANLMNLLAGVATYLAAARQVKTGNAAFARQPWWGVPAVLVPVAHLWWVVAWTERVLPRSVTTWIYPEERHLFNHFAFAMLPLFLGMLRIAGARPARNLGKTIALNLGFAVGAPVALYLLVMVLSSFAGFRGVSGIVFVVGIVVCGVLMFVGLIRGLMLGLRRVRNLGSGGERVAIIVFAAILPLAGLVLNRSIPFPVDFQAWEIYALVIVNAAILLVAAVQRVAWPRLSFYLLSATFPFSLYFFIVFLPYIPLSILAVIVMGAGFLVLAPIFLFVLHLYSLHQARSSPAIGADKLRVTLTGVGCALLLPGFFVARGVADKTALNAALDHVYAPAVTRENLIYPASLTNLRRALGSHRAYKNGIYYPLLSDFYSWLVFDHLVLPDEKLDRLEEIFFGEAGSRLNSDPIREGLNPWGGRRSVRERSRMPQAVPVARTVKVSNLQMTRTASPVGDAMTTFTITLQNIGPVPAEFRQKLPLPSGIFVSGFRLHINGQPVSGRIFEKKTALWVYTMIRDSERRDPGLLYYHTPDELELCVFPVDPQAPSVVEIDFLHPVPVEEPRFSSVSEDLAVRLAELGRAVPLRLTGNRHEVAVAGNTADQFPAAERAPYLHLIVDRSLDNAYTADLRAAIGTLRERFPAARLGRITLANHDSVDLVENLTPLDELAQKISAEWFEKLPASGGLALDLTLARAIRQHRDLDLDHVVEEGGPPLVPVFVVLSRKASARSLELELAKNWRDLLPGIALCELGADGSFQTLLQAAEPSPLLKLGNSVRPVVTRQVIRFPYAEGHETFYHWSPEASAWRPVSGAGRFDGTAWSRAVLLYSQDQDHARAPGGHGADRKALIGASRESGILLPTSSYIVVESQAQWRVLELSEAQKLAQNDALDFRETPAPSAVWLGGGLLAWLWLRRWRNAKHCPSASIPVGTIGRLSRSLEPLLKQTQHHRRKKAETDQ